MEEKKIQLEEAQGAHQELVQQYQKIKEELEAEKGRSAIYKIQIEMKDDIIRKERRKHF